jgi:pseudo-rSAM protein
MNTMPLKKGIWLYIQPYVYISTKKNHAVLYNELNKNILEYRKEDVIIDYIKKIDNNLYKHFIPYDKINGSIVKLINDIRTNHYGDISAQKPFIFKPILSLKQNMTLARNEYKKNKIKVLERNQIRDYLNTISIYLNSSCNLNCHICNTAHKQFLSCFRDNSSEMITPETFRLINEELIGCHNLSVVNILGGNIFKHPDYYEIIKIQKKKILNGKVNYYSHYCNIPEDERYLKVLSNKQIYLILLIDFPVNELKLKKNINYFKANRINYICNFIIESNEQVSITEKIIRNCSIQSVNILPFYNQRNSDFFKENVFVNRSDISNSELTIKEILANGKLNSNLFGKLTVLNTGEVFANVNNKKLGNFPRENIIELMTMELKKGHAWAKIRNSVLPCKKCAYHSICPSISNYEIALNKFNMCTIRDDQDGN